MTINQAGRDCVSSWIYRVLVCAGLVLALVAGAGASASLFSSQPDDEFLPAEDVFVLDPLVTQAGQTSLTGTVAPGYYVYRHSLSLADAKGDPVALALPAGQAKHDEFFGDTEIYSGQVPPLRFPADAQGPLTLHWQGCAEAGICYPPQTVTLAAGGGVAGPAAATAPELAQDEAAAQRLASLSPVSGVLLFFGFGLLLAFTPCTLPMIPIVSTMVVGGQVRAARAFALSLVYVLAMAGTYALVGVAAGLAGANLQATLQSPWLLSAFAGLFLVLAASLFGAFELRLPAGLLNRVESAGRGRAGGSLVGAGALGVLSALLVGPCMTAPLAGALLYISQTGSAFYGGMALFALGLGMGLPLLAIAVFGARILPRPGAWMDRVRVAFGYVMVAMAIWMLERILSPTLSLLLWGAWLLTLAVGLLGWSAALAQRPRGAWTLRSVAAVAGVWAVLMMTGAASGGVSLLQPLARSGAPAPMPSASAAPATVKTVQEVQGRLDEAAAAGQWTLIDFYADWCVSCKVIEATVFGDPRVAERLSRMQVLRPDVTLNDRQDRDLLKHWGVMGPPTLILVGPDGQERRAQRTVGEISADAFLQRLDAAGAP
nr:protein-disulfide reductase DsbD [Bordetella trematum]